MSIEKPTDLKPHTRPGFAGRPDLAEPGVEPLQRRQHEFAPERIRVTYDDSPSPTSVDDFHPRDSQIDIDLKNLEEEMRNSNLDKMRKLLLSLTFGEKMEMSDGVAKFLKSDSFSLAMCLHRWAKGEVADAPSTSQVPSDG